MWLIVNLLKAIVASYIGTKVYHAASRVVAELIVNQDLKNIGRPASPAVRKLEAGLLLGLHLFGLSWLRDRIKEREV